MVPGKPTAARTSAGFPFTVTSTGEFTESQRRGGERIARPDVRLDGDDQMDENDEDVVHPGIVSKSQKAPEFRADL
jgi:hypothetical protein